MDELTFPPNLQAVLLMRRLEGERQFFPPFTSLCNVPISHLGSVGCFCQTDSDLDETADESEEDCRAELLLARNPVHLLAVVTRAQAREGRGDPPIPLFPPQNLICILRWHHHCAS